MKKMILAVALMMLAATAATAADAPTPNPFDKPAQEMRRVGDDAANVGLDTALLPVRIVLLPLQAISYPSRLTEIGDEYAQMIPGSFGRFAARAGLAPLRLAFAIPAAPWYAIEYVAGLYSGTRSASN